VDQPANSPSVTNCGLDGVFSLMCNRLSFRARQEGGLGLKVLGE
jgi:hypothetical protein